MNVASRLRWRCAAATRSRLARRRAKMSASTHNLQSLQTNINIFCFSRITFVDCAHANPSSSFCTPPPHESSGLCFSVPIDVLLWIVGSSKCSILTLWITTIDSMETQAGLVGAPALITLLDRHPPIARRTI